MESLDLIQIHFRSKENLKENNSLPVAPSSQSHPPQSSSAEKGESGAAPKPQLPVKPSQIREDGELLVSETTHSRGFKNVASGIFHRKAEN